MTFRRYMVLAFVSLSAPLGDTFLDVGMKRLGPVSLAHISTLFHAVSTPWVAGGIVLLIGFFASYLQRCRGPILRLFFLLPLSGMWLLLCWPGSGGMNRSHCRDGRGFS
jgi:hypothetical protein